MTDGEIFPDAAAIAIFAGDEGGSVHGYAAQCIDGQLAAGTLGRHTAAADVQYAVARADTRLVSRGGRLHRTAGDIDVAGGGKTIAHAAGCDLGRAGDGDIFAGINSGCERPCGGGGQLAACHGEAAQTDTYGVAIFSCCARVYGQAGDCKPSRYLDHAHPLVGEGQDAAARECKGSGFFIPVGQGACAYCAVHFHRNVPDGAEYDVVAGAPDAAVAGQGQSGRFRVPLPDHAADDCVTAVLGQVGNHYGAAKLQEAGDGAGCPEVFVCRCDNIYGDIGQVVFAQSLGQGIARAQHGSEVVGFVFRVLIIVGAFPRHGDGRFTVRAVQGHGQRPRQADSRHGGLFRHLDGVQRRGAVKPRKAGDGLHKGIVRRRRVLFAAVLRAFLAHKGAGRTGNSRDIAAVPVMLMLAVQLLSNAAAFLAAHMSAFGRLFFLRVGRRGVVVRYAVLRRVAVVRMLVDALRHFLVALGPVLMGAGDFRRPLGVAALIGVRRVVFAQARRVHRRAALQRIHRVHPRHGKYHGEGQKYG